MRADFEATLAHVHALFDARLAAAERAAEGADATDAERHIVRALRKLREAPPQPRKREEGARKQWSNWTSPRDNLSEEDQRKELERSLNNLIGGSPPAPDRSTSGV